MAHAICQKQAHNALYYGRDAVVSNTFTQRWEMQPYLYMAEKTGAHVEIITAAGNYGNIHDVPDDVIAAMVARWEEVVL